ncbi:MAG: LysR family transcriptional regulator [Gemmatimonas sp.]
MDRLKLMETYAAVVKLGSYTQAAKELGVTRAMVSKRIQDLEAALGVKLLNRNTHRLSPTLTGTDYYENCVSLLAEMNALDERIQAKRSVPRGEIKILSSKTFSETVLGPIASEFCRAHPGISVHIALRDRDSSSHGMELVTGGFDLAIRSMPARDSSLVARPIMGLPRVLVASPDYLATHGTPRGPSELAKHSCLDPSGAAHSTWTFEGPKGRTAVRVSGTMRANSSVVVRHAALDGLGIALLREYLVADDLAHGALVRVLADHAIDERTLYIVYQKDRYQPARVRLFIDYFIARMKRRDGGAAPMRAAAPRG